MVTHSFWKLVDRSDPNGCWPWMGSVRKNGYGQIFPRDGLGRLHYAHRMAYELSKESIPKGLVIDHLCRVRKCCNPAHLRVVTQRVNLLNGKTLQAANAARTECLRGHPFSKQNTYVDSLGKRCCRVCRRAALRRFRARQRN